MQTDLSKVSTPRTIHYEYEEKENEGNNNGTLTGPALAGCAKFTSKTGELVFSPKYSVLVNGIMAMNDNSGGDYGRPIGQGIGFLMVMTTPAVLGIKCLLGIPCVVGGATATVALAPVYFAEKVIKTVVHGIGGIFGPSEATLRRKEYTEQFVARMHDTLEKFNTVQKDFFEKNPESLVCLSATVVAFLSRDLKMAQLKVGDDILEKDDLEGMGKDATEYFKMICKMKSCIRDLELSLDNAHAWETLTAFIMASTNEENDLQESQKEALNLLTQVGEELSQMVVKDEIFKAAWEKSLA